VTERREIGYCESDHDHDRRSRWRRTY
jgi:hypothetical protein